jgi:hypothetical protein
MKQTMIRSTKPWICLRSTCSHFLLRCSGQPSCMLAMACTSCCKLTFQTRQSTQIGFTAHHFGSTRRLSLTPRPDFFSMQIWWIHVEYVLVMSIKRKNKSEEADGILVQECQFSIPFKYLLAWINIPTVSVAYFGSNRNTSPSATLRLQNGSEESCANR